MGVAPPTSSRRGFAQRASMLLCVLGVLAYLCMPLLHAVHVGGDAGGPPRHREAHTAHHCHHHAHAHTDAPGDTGDNRSFPSEGHDPESCGVCRVFFAVRVHANLPPALTVQAPFESRFKPIELEAQRVVVMSASPERPLRGPPEA